MLSDTVPGTPALSRVLPDSLPLTWVATGALDYDVSEWWLVPPTEISIFINDASISELHLSIRSQGTNHKSDQEIFLIARSNAEFSSRSFLFSSLTFLKSCKFPWFLVGISTIVLTHRLQTEDLLILLSQQIKKVSVVIFQFLVAATEVKGYVS